MANSDDFRWQQRLENFGLALAQLERACDQSEYTELERAGLVQMFEISFELAWKTLKDLLFIEGITVNTPREIIRQAFEADYLDASEAESMLDALDKRNLLAHTYHEKTAIEAQALIKNRYTPALRQLRDTLQSKRDP